jgi:hypothetical protein
MLYCHGKPRGRHDFSRCLFLEAEKASHHNQVEPTRRVPTEEKHRARHVRRTNVEDEEEGEVRFKYASNTRVKLDDLQTNPRDRNPLRVMFPSFHLSLSQFAGIATSNKCAVRRRKMTVR